MTALFLSKTELPCCSFASSAASQPRRLSYRRWTLPQPHQRAPLALDTDTTTTSPEPVCCQQRPRHCPPFTAIAIPIGPCIRPPAHYLVRRPETDKPIDAVLLWAISVIGVPSSTQRRAANSKPQPAPGLLHTWALYPSQSSHCLTVAAPVHPHPHDSSARRKPSRWPSRPSSRRR